MRKKRGIGPSVTSRSETTHDAIFDTGCSLFCLLGPLQRMERMEHGRIRGGCIFRFRRFSAAGCSRVTSSRPLGLERLGIRGASSAGRPNSRLFVCAGRKTGQGRWSAIRNLPCSPPSPLFSRCSLFFSSFVFPPFFFCRLCGVEQRVDW